MTYIVRARARFLACAVAGAAALMPVNTVAQTAVSLDEAIDRALVRSPIIAQQQQAVDNAYLTKRTSWASFLPTVTGNSSGSLRSANTLNPTTGEIVSGSSDSYSAGVTGSLTVFEGLRRFRVYDASKADVRAAEARYANQRYQVTLQTKNFFFNALRQADLLEVAHQRVSQAEQNLDIVRRRTLLGEATISDSLRARLDVLNAQQTVLQSETAVRSARSSLGRQIGLSERVTPTRPGDLEPSPLSLTESEILEMAVSVSPPVIAASEASIAARANVAVAKSAYIPTLRFSSGYNWQNQVRSFSGGSTSWNLGLSLSYPIFNGFQRESAIDRAQFIRRVSLLQEDDARLAAREQADAALQNLLTAERAIVIAGDAAFLAAEDLRVVRERYTVGVATILDILISQSAADQANTDVITTRYDYILARAELEAILGRDL